MTSSYYLLGKQAWDTSSVLLGPQGPGGKEPFAAAGRDGFLTWLSPLSSKSASISIVPTASLWGMGTQELV